MRFKTSFISFVMPFMLLAFLSASCGGRKDNTFTIEGNIAGVRDSVNVVLFKLVDPISGFGKGAATDTLIDGKFSFTIPVEDSLDRYNLAIIGDRLEFPPQNATIFVEPGGKAVITGTGASPMKWEIKSKVKKQKDWQTYLNYTADVSSEQGLVLINRDLAPEKKKSLLDSLRKKSFSKSLEYLESEKTSDVWIYEFHSWAKYAGLYKDEEMRSKLKALLPRLSEKQMKDPLMLDALPYLDVFPPLNVGDAFPAFTMYDADGLQHKVSDFSGKKVLVELSEFGCGPCIRSHSEIEELCKKHPDDFVSLIVNQDRYDKWKKEVKASSIPNMYELNDSNDLSGIFKRLGTRAYPTFVLVSPAGIIIDIWRGYSEGSLLKRF